MTIGRRFDPQSGLYLSIIIDYWTSEGQLLHQVHQRLEYGSRRREGRQYMGDVKVRYSLTHSLGLSVWAFSVGGAFSLSRYQYGWIALGLETRTGGAERKGWRRTWGVIKLYARYIHPHPTHSQNLILILILVPVLLTSYYQPTSCCLGVRAPFDIFPASTLSSPATPSLPLLHQGRFCTDN